MSDERPGPPVPEPDDDAESAGPHFVGSAAAGPRFEGYPTPGGTDPVSGGPTARLLNRLRRRLGRNAH
jgi:hypothetical protein